MMEFILTIDVEDWFQVENLKEIVQGRWEDKESRVGINTHRILDLLDTKNSVATFFVLGWVAEKFPDMVKEIAARGHEVASHGYGHELVYKMDQDDFREDVKRSKVLLEDMTGKTVVGYRAPSFSITDWATDILCEEGFIYDSSYFDFKMNRYGTLDLLQATKQEGKNIYQLKNGLYEIPATVLNMMGKNLPWSGGGYFRFIPLQIFVAGFQKAMRQKGISMFYMHPWEIDAGQPRVKGLKKNHAFRHYFGLHNTIKKMDELVNKMDAGQTCGQYVEEVSNKFFCK